MNEKAKTTNNGSFLKLFKTLTARDLSSPNIFGLRPRIFKFLNLIKHCCSCFKHYVIPLNGKHWFPEILWLHATESLSKEEMLTFSKVLLIYNSTIKYTSKYYKFNKPAHILLAVISTDQRIYPALLILLFITKFDIHNMAEHINVHFMSNLVSNLDITKYYMLFIKEQYYGV